ncbi:MAG TPA: hypothetical protein VK791_07370 [bacterium]|nr:hypothetical protein [bacterium]
MKNLFILALLLLVVSPVHGEAQPDFYFANYEIMDLDFLRTHYYEINNGRQIQIDAYYKSKTWLEPFAYKERLRLIGFNIDNYNLIQMSLEEKDEYHYTFPILMFHSQTGDLKELDQLKDGDRIIIYGRFYNLKNDDFAIEVDVIDQFNADRIDKSVTLGEYTGGHDQGMLLDARVSPSPTPTASITPTPGPSLWQRINDKVNPKPTATPTGTITPEAAE